MARDEKTDDRVGYRKPPAHTRIKKGASGNPKGRPKSSEGVGSILEEELARPVTIIEDGRQIRMTKERASGRVTSNGQSGGQTAGTINNNGPVYNGPVFNVPPPESHGRGQITQPNSPVPNNADSSAMPALHDLFKSDFSNLFEYTINGIKVQLPGAEDLRLEAVLYIDPTSSSYFVGQYIPATSLTALIAAAFATEYQDFIDKVLHDFEMSSKGSGDSSPTTLKDSRFTGRVYIYHERALSLRELADLTDLYNSKGLKVQFRSFDYVMSIWNDRRLKQQRPYGSQ